MLHNFQDKLSNQLLTRYLNSLSYFLPLILQSGMGFSSDQAILLSAPPYFYAVIPVIISSIVGDKYQLRGLVITFNCICTVVGFSMLGFASQVTVRYVGTYLATGAYVSNWAAMNAYQASNIVGQWKRQVQFCPCFKSSAFHSPETSREIILIRWAEQPLQLQLQLAMG